MDKKELAWQKSRQYTAEQLAVARTVLDEIRSGRATLEAIRSYPLKGGGYVAKHTLIHEYYRQVGEGISSVDDALLKRLRMKPVRSLSGVSTVTVLTKPHPCPGECIFCPDDARLPKSYLKEEPGAARAFQNHFDPYLQVTSRIDAYRATGHPVDKIELLILGGTWSAYPRDYRDWFIKRCFDAMNGCDAPTLAAAQELNESAGCRNVGLVIETRPDCITLDEIIHFRQLGVTKVQMGAQSFDDAILLKNRRGHTSAQTLAASALLRAAGFKIVLHWMPNLLGATPDSDREDFMHMWQGGFCPDEIKIYPTQLLKEAPLYRLWQQGKYHPYSTRQLIDLIADIKPSIPPYCRVNRIIRDIPASYIQAGSRRSNLRQDILEELNRRGQRCRCIRCREVRGTKVSADDITLGDDVYQAAFAEEHFINFTTSDDRLAGYLRLSLPRAAADARSADLISELEDRMPELKGAALVREVHVFGQSLEVGSEMEGAAQHRGLGSALLVEAERVARKAGFCKLAVIAAVGTRLYYAGRGFAAEGLYMTKDIP